MNLYDARIELTKKVIEYRSIFNAKRAAQYGSKVVCEAANKLVLIAFNEGYKSGQIDALSGDVKYELKSQPNGETLWVEKGATTNTEKIEAIQSLTHQSKE